LWEIIEELHESAANFVRLNALWFEVQIKHIKLKTDILAMFFNKSVFDYEEMEV
jgi:hypothetical protein